MHRWFQNCNNPGRWEQKHLKVDFGKAFNKKLGVFANTAILDASVDGAEKMAFFSGIVTKRRLSVKRKFINRPLLPKQELNR